MPGTYSNAKPGQFDASLPNYEYHPVKDQSVPEGEGNETGGVPYYVDIHCHSTLMPFSRTNRTTVDEFWPPEVSESDVEKQRFEKTPTFYQSDFTTLAKSKVRVAFVSLCPLEQGFFSSRLTPFAARYLGINRDRWKEVKSIEHDYFEDLEKEYNLLANKNYWKYPRLLLELLGLRMLRKLWGQIMDNLPQAKLVSNYDELSKSLGAEKDTIAAVTTIEGGHSIGCGSAAWLEKIGDDKKLDDMKEGCEDIGFELDDPSFENPADSCPIADRFKVDEVSELVRLLLVNIKKIKNWEGGKFAPFFITFSHHFWNQLCGHALSLPPWVSSWIDQDRGLEEKITKVGKVVLSALLSKNNGKRVLIDTKHMSLAGKDWYYSCVEQFNWYLDSKPELKIPIISSHSAVNGDQIMPEIAMVIDTAEAKKNYENSTQFNPWEINLTDGEIVRIHKSNGLIGLNMDERVLLGKQLRDSLHGSDKKIKKLRRKQRRNESPETARLINEKLEQVIAPWKYQWTVPIAEHICHVAKVIADDEGLEGSPEWNDEDDQPAKKPWRRLAIGSDFDGVINPIDPYCRAIDLTGLETQLKQCLKNMRSDKDYIGKYPLLERLTDSNISQIVDWFMRGNAMDFLKMYFTDEYRT